MNTFAIIISRLFFLSVLSLGCSLWGLIFGGILIVLKKMYVIPPNMWYWFIISAVVTVCSGYVLSHEAEFKRAFEDEPYEHQERE